MATAPPAADGPRGAQAADPGGMPHTARMACQVHRGQGRHCVSEPLVKHKETALPWEQRQLDELCANLYHVGDMKHRSALRTAVVPLPVACGRS